MDNQINNIVESAIDKIKSISDVSTIVGNPIETGDGIIVPVSKVSVGFIAGGGEYKSDKTQIKSTKSYPFSGGSGGGVCITPVGFIVINKGNFKYIKADGKTPYDKIIECIPKVIESFKKEENCKNEN